MDSSVLPRMNNHSFYKWKGIFNRKMWVHARSLQLYLTLCDPMNCSPQAPLSLGFSREEHQSGLPCPLPGDLPDPGIESLMSPALAGRFFTTSAIWEAHEKSQNKSKKWRWLYMDIHACEHELDTTIFSFSSEYKSATISHTSLWISIWEPLLYLILPI